MAWRRLILVVAGSVALTAAVAAQEPTFSSSAALVVRTVSVVDAEGRPIEGLTAADFIVHEDDAPQTLAFVEFQRLRDETMPEQVAVSPGAPGDVARVTATGFVSAGPSDIRYRDRRLLVFYFDMAGLSGADRVRALLSADTFVASQMSAADLVAVMRFSGDGVRVEQEFTDDRERLRHVIALMIYENDLDGDGVPDEPIDQSTAFGQNTGEFNFLRTDRQLAALQTAALMLGSIAGQKVLLHFVSGLTLSGLDNQAQLAATVNAAIRANVSINPIDARGLVAEAPAGDANVASPAGLSAFTGTAVQVRRDRFERSQDTMYGIARDTGGTALFNYNDLALGIRRAASAVTSYYVLGYYTTRPERDGRLRRVRISVAGQPSARLTYRDSYFAEKAFSRFTNADRERQLEDALLLGDPITEIPIAVEVNYFQLNRSEYFVPVSVKMPGQQLTIERGRRESRTEVDLIGEIKDERGVTVQNVRDRLQIPLSTDAATALAVRPIQFEMGFTLLPGTYAIKMLARDSESGRIGTFLGHFTVPTLSRETERVRMSSVVLSHQRVAMTDALFSVRQRVSGETAHPLVSAGMRLLPSVTRVFPASGDIHALFHVYPMTDAGPSRLLAFMSIYRDDEKVFDSAAIEVDATAALVPVELTVPAGTLTPGRYQSQVSVLDLGQNKVVFSRVPLVVVPGR